jgi:SAM-dependent methyltransferase
MNNSDTKTDSDWEGFARQDPYWAVWTENRFRTAQLDAAARQEFFASGESYIDHAFETIRLRLDGQFSPARALDFGCGVGRLVLALAKRCESVVGVDVSDSMLGEARANLQSCGLDNVTLVKGDDNLSGVTGRFDFVNTLIVLQHIPCPRGQRIFRRLIDLLDDGGVGAIHVNYSHATRRGHARFDQPEWPADAPAGGFWSHLTGLRRAARRGIARLIPRRKWPDAAPQIQMNTYSLNPLFHYIQEAGGREMYCQFNDHAGHYGVVLYFKKTPKALYCV